MPSIPSVVNQGPTDVGLDEIYVELRIRLLGATFELYADTVQYSSMTGPYRRHEIGRQIAEDASATCDLEWDAYKVRTGMDANGTCKSFCGLGQAIEKLFSGSYCSYLIAAE
jgi:hypothetical protein